jgi:predicted membrane protein
MNDTIATPSAAARITPRLIVGLGILSLGLLWTLDNLNLINAHRITEWWPIIIVAVGVAKFFDARSSRIAAVVIAFVGTLILIDNLDYADIDFGDLIPLGIALIGGKLVWDAVTRRGVRKSGDEDPAALINAFAVMAGVGRQSTSQAFRGGDATAIMGGVEIDLRNAQIAPNEEAVIDVFALWGGVELIVPDHWRVVGNVMPLLGGFDDKSVSPSTGPILVVRGAAVMGAIAVKNASHAPRSR